MKSKNKILQRIAKLFLLISSFILLSVCLTGQVLGAKYYRIQSVIIQARLHPDGSMDIQEKRTYNFRGAFHWATYFLPKEKIGEIVDFSIGEEGKPYLRSSAGTTGTYEYEESPEYIQSKWYFDARNEERTFIISYKIRDAMQLYQDAAVLYYKFIGSGWDQSSQKVQVEIFPPEPASKDQIRAWAHGPLWGSIEILDDGKVRAEVQSLPANTFWEVRAIYPPGFFPNIKNKTSIDMIPQILSEEKIWADEANARRAEWHRSQEIKETRKRYGSWIVTGLSVIGLLGFLILRNRYGIKHRVPFPDTYFSEIPSEISPALLSCLLYQGQLGGTALIGTILDLAQRGFLKIKEEPITGKQKWWDTQKRRYLLEFDRSFYATNKDKLQNFENELLDFLFNDLSRGKDVLDFKSLTKERAHITRWFYSWQKEVRKIGQEKGFWEKESLKARNKVLIFSFILLAVTIPSIYFIEEWAFMTGVFGILLLMLSFTIPRRSPEYELEAKKWEGLKKYLKKYYFRESLSQSLQQNLGRFMVYGMVLGLSSKVIKCLAEMIPAEHRNKVVPWYVYTGAPSDFSPAGFAESLSSLMSTASSTVSSATGTGGGASGGGGGGGGGSGGGAG
ncbi:MAG TPA: DUF2207 domain-containing protein [Terriglobales bacterium]|nr:DUF2207 domain-containing protein [Terriglobales bacterium]